jgi:hypothetical protein
MNTNDHNSNSANDSIKWNDIGDIELAGMMEEAAELDVPPMVRELLNIGSQRLLRASTRHRNLSSLVFGTGNKKNS